MLLWWYMLIFCAPNPVRDVSHAQFGNQQTKNMVLSWLVSYGITFAIVEPFQVHGMRTRVMCYA